MCAFFCAGSVFLDVPSMFVVWVLLFCDLLTLLEGVLEVLLCPDSLTLPYLTSIVLTLNYNICIIKAVAGRKGKYDKRYDKYSISVKLL